MSKQVYKSLGMAVEDVTTWMDTRGFPRTHIPAVPREVDQRTATDFAEKLRSLHEDATSDSAFRCRTAMILQELAEMFEAIATDNVVKYADAVTDLLWVVISVGVSTGLPIKELWELVVVANFQKEIGGVKPDNWVSPNERMLDLLTEKGGVSCLESTPIQ